MRLGKPEVREIFKRAICRFPTEWDRNTIIRRYGWLTTDEEFRIEEGKDWEDFKAHAEAISFDDLPQEYKDAVWHVHPRTFISHMRQCGRLVKKDLKKIFPQISEPYLTQVLDELNTVSGKHFLNTPLRQAHFFGQVRQEAGPAMAATSENLNYSPHVLESKFRYYRVHPSEARSDGYERLNGKITKPANQEAIANKAYFGRNGNLPSQPGDGWRFRGRGLKQITGRQNYAGFDEDYHRLCSEGQRDFVASPESIAQFPYSVRSAVWFWTSRGCPRIADREMSDASVDAISDIVNAGEQGEPRTHRRTYAANAFEVLS